MNTCVCEGDFFERIEGGDKEFGGFGVIGVIGEFGVIREFREFRVIRVIGVIGGFGVKRRIFQQEMCKETFDT